MNTGRAMPRWCLPLALLVAVVPLWGLPRDFHDGVIAEWAYATGRWSGVAEWLFTSNWWGHYALYRAADAAAIATSTPPWLWIKLWMTALVVGLAYEAYRYALLHGFARPSALAAAAITASFPAWCVLYSSAVLHIGFAWLAFLGHRWLFWSGGWRRVAGALLVVASFQVAANLVVQVVLALLACVLPASRGRRAWLLAGFVTLAAVAWYVFWAKVHPPQGEYAGYNALLLPTSARNVMKVLGTVALFASWAVLLVPAFVVAWRHPRGGGDRGRPSLEALDFRRRGEDVSRRLAIAFLLLAAAVFPYAMVGKGPPLFLLGEPRVESAIWTVYASTGRFFHFTLEAFTTRQAALMALPFALAAVACIEALARGDTRRMRTAVGVAVAVQAAVLAAGHVSKWEQAHWDRSVVEALRRLPPPPGGRVELALAPTRPYMAHLWESNSLLWHAWGRTAWLGVVHYQGNDTWEAIVRARLPRYGELVRQGQAMREYHLMADFDPASSCVTRIAAAPSTALLAPWEWVAQLVSGHVAPAAVSRVETNCGEQVFSGQR